MHATRGALLATLLGALSVCAKSRYKTHGGPLPGGPKQVREYTLDIDYFPYNADGRTIFAMGANGQFPAPAIEANVNDTLIVWVNNRMKTEAVSIHWHGLEQRLRPWMDGVVGVTQCAIAPNTSFKYVFEITEHPGTYWYHNHNGLNKVGARALQGALIIHARNKSEEIHGKDYDEERTFMLQDWFTDTEVMEMDLALGGQNPPLTITREFMISSSVPYDGLLINGLGWNGPPGHQPPFGRYDSPPPPLEFRDIINVRPKSNAWGGRYRLRLTNAGASFSVQFCVDDHRLTVIASDGADTLPFEVDCVNIAPAERYDVILTADQRLQNYWIRSSTLERDYNHTAYAVLAYEGAVGGEVMMPTTWPTRNGQPLTWDQKEVANCFDWGGITANCHSLTELTRHPDTCYWGYCGAPTDKAWTPHDIAARFTFPQVGNFVRFGYSNAPFTGTFIQNELPNLGVPLVHGYNGSVTGKALSTQYTGRGYDENDNVEAPQPMLHGYGREGGTVGWHTNSMVMEIADGEHAELIFNQPDRQSHPIHVHGHKLWVMGVGYVSSDPKECTFIHCFKQHFDRMNRDDVAKLVDPNKAILKDSVVLPAGGWLVLRFVADNPGWWFAHCHIDIHRSNGFNFMIREGGDKAEVDPARLPSDFPTCEPMFAKKHYACQCFQDRDAVLDLSPRAYYRCSTKQMCRHSLPADPDGGVTGVRRREEQRPMRYGLAAAVLAVLVLVIYVPAFASYLEARRKSRATLASPPINNLVSQYTSEIGKQQEKMQSQMHDAVNTMTSFGGDGLSIVWENVAVTATGKGGAKVPLLTGMHGCVRPGEMMAVMGTSGSGKSTLLDVLAGRKLRGSAQVSEGQVLLGGTSVDNIRWGALKILRSYVPQQDVLQDNLTPSESLMIHALLRRPRVRRNSVTELKHSSNNGLVLSNAALRDLNASSARKQVKEILATLKLSHRSDTLINQLSGGERRRLMVAMRSIVKQPITLMDEPTSGLDAQSAIELMAWTKSLTLSQRKSTIVTIHSPNSALFELFDKVMLVHRGQLVFGGSLSQAANFFKSIQRFTPVGWGAADYYLSLMDVEGPQIAAAFTNARKPDGTGTAQTALEKWQEEGATTIEDELKSQHSRVDTMNNAIEEAVAEKQRSGNSRSSIPDWVARTSCARQSTVVPGLGRGSPSPHVHPNAPSSPRMGKPISALWAHVSGRESRLLSRKSSNKGSIKSDRAENNPGVSSLGMALSMMGLVSHNTEDVDLILEVPGFVAQVRLLFWRDLQQEWTAVFNWQNLLLNGCLSCMIGAIWFQSGSQRDERGFRETIALFFYIDLYWAFTAMYTSIVALGPKLPLLQLNINEGVHSLGSWCVARMFVEVLLVGVWPVLFCTWTFAFADIGPNFAAIVNMLCVMYANVIAAQSFGLAVATLVPNVRLAQIAGYYTTLPSWLAWYMDLSIPRFIFEGLLRCEFTPFEAFECPPQRADPFTGPYLCALEKSLTVDDLKKRGLRFAEIGSEFSPWSNIGILFGFAMIFRIIIYLGLRWAKQTQWRQGTGRAASSQGGQKLIAEVGQFVGANSPGGSQHPEASDALGKALSRQVTFNARTSSFAKKTSITSALKSSKSFKPDKRRTSDISEDPPEGTPESMNQESMRDGAKGAQCYSSNL